MVTKKRSPSKYNRKVQKQTTLRPMQTDCEN